MCARQLAAWAAVLVFTVLGGLGTAKWRQIALNNRLVQVASQPNTSVAQVEALLETGANPNAREVQFPRMRFTRELAPELLDWMRHPEHREGGTALSAAACMGRADLVRALLAAGADPRITSGEMYGGHPVLIGWAQSHAPGAKASGREVARLLLDHGAELNPQTSGMTPLMLASFCHQASTVRLLLERGANPNATDRRGWTALRYGIGSGAIEADTVRALLEHGADVNARAPDGLTPYGRALQAKSPTPILNLLRLAGATE